MSTADTGEVMVLGLWHLVRLLRHNLGLSHIADKTSQNSKIYMIVLDVAGNRQENG